jgi:leader peptidase (prepilin peptidase)/N-methyltransferase
MSIAVIGWAIWCVGVFVLGLSAGSFLQVAAVRLPYEKSLLWPGSHCMACLKAIAWHDNIPILGWLLLRGKCRNCQAPFSIRYLLVEIFAGLGFLTLFALEVILDVRGVGWWKQFGWTLQGGLVPWQAWLVWAAEAMLFSLLLVASICDLEHQEIPLSITVTGCLIGLVFSTLCPWPFPLEGQAGAALVAGRIPEEMRFPVSLHPWPVSWPMPAWLAPGAWWTGLASGLAGAFAGTLICRVIRFVYGLGRGRESLGLGDSDLLLMAGAFVGWQVVLSSFFVSLAPGIVMGLGFVLLRGSQALPFGPSLALGVLISWFTWPWLGPKVGWLFLDPITLGLMGLAGAGGLLVLSFVLRLVSGRDVEESPAGGGQAP